MVDFIGKNVKLRIMARPKQYVRSAVVESAMQLFWTRGYTDTSLSDLVEHTGINRVSLYNEFGNKQGLFLAALDLYFDISANWLEPLIAPDAGLEQLVDWFEQTIDGLESDQWRGGMMVNAAAELAAVNTEVRERTERHFRRVHEVFSVVLRNANDRNTIKPGIDIEGVAGALLQLAIGMLIRGASLQRPEELLRAFRAQVSLIDGRTEVRKNVRTSSNRRRTLSRGTALDS